MAPKENPRERFRHKRSNDPLQNQTPGIGQQPYRGDDTNERSSLDDDNTSTFENRKNEKER